MSNGHRSGDRSTTIHISSKKGITWTGLGARGLFRFPKTIDSDERKYFFVTIEEIKGNRNNRCWRYQTARFRRRIGKNASISVLCLRGYFEGDQINKYFLKKLKITVIFSSYLVGVLK